MYLIKFHTALRKFYWKLTSKITQNSSFEANSASIKLSLISLLVCRVAMVDYGEFVPEALATSNHGHLRALGDRLDLVFVHNDYAISYTHLLQLALDGSHAITETYSYLR